MRQKNQTSANVLSRIKRVMREPMACRRKNMRACKEQYDLVALMKRESEVKGKRYTEKEHQLGFC